LHIEAPSGQVQENRMSDGIGNSPLSWQQIRSITPFENRPCSSSTRESMPPAQSVQIERHSAGASALMLTVIL
jgi:hypothetical protein